ncbi:MAG: hypothetical protein LBV73_30715, partial [Paraburkholderia sp.]|nr:hypothetical protein [Paraburkholderia sp.]
MWRSGISLARLRLSREKPGKSIAIQQVIGFKMQQGCRGASTRKQLSVAEDRVLYGVITCMKVDKYQTKPDGTSHTKGRQATYLEVSRN